MILLIVLALSGFDAGPQQTLVAVFVIDGDTVVTRDNERIRLLGINAPETGGPYRDREPLGDQAKAQLEQLTEHGVLIEPGKPSRDKYDRLLAHLFDGNGRHINRQMLASGFAHLSVIPPNTEYTDSLLAAQTAAIAGHRGIWSHPHYQSVALGAKFYRRKGWQRLKVTIRDYRRGKSGFHRLILDERTELRIPEANLRYFDNLAEYVGMTLEARGWLSERKGYYSMLIRHPSALVEL